MGRLADGWMPFALSPERLRRGLDAVHAAARAAGRSPFDIGVDTLLWPRSADERVWRAELERWLHTSAVTHLSFVTLETGFESPTAHIAAIRRFKELADALGA